MTISYLSQLIMTDHQLRKSNQFPSPAQTYILTTADALAPYWHQAIIKDNADSMGTTV